MHNEHLVHTTRQHLSHSTRGQRIQKDFIRSRQGTYRILDALNGLNSNVSIRGDMMKTRNYNEYKQILNEYPTKTGSRKRWDYIITGWVSEDIANVLMSDGSKQEHKHRGESLILNNGSKTSCWYH